MLVFYNEYKIHTIAPNIIHEDIRVCQYLFQKNFWASVNILLIFQQKVIKDLLFLILYDIIYIVYIYYIKKY